MRPLTSVGAAALILAAGIAAAAPAGAEPTDTEPTGTEASAEPTGTEASAEPTGTEASAEPTSTEASAEPTSTPDGARQVTYTVTTTSDLTANIYYVAGDPPDQASANKPQYMPMSRTTVGPGAPWTMQVSLDDPTEWAFVSASGGLRVNPEFRCEIAVDGEVVISQQGGSGVQCALRPW